jgi:metal-responsive CopG/Arc/MetJ family transcriptional regulator
MPQKRTSKKVEYVSLSIPKDLIIEVERTMEDFPELSYTSVSEFVREALRDYILYLRSVERRAEEKNLDKD